MANQPRSYISFFTVLAALLLLLLAYNAGYRRGQGVFTELRMTIDAQAIALSVPTFTPTPEPPTATPPPTATLSPSPTPSPTPSFTPTPTGTPASAQQWGERFVARAVEWLNAPTDVDFTPERAAELVRRAALEQGLSVVPVSYFPLEITPWAVLAMPRTPDGQVLPAIFWRDPYRGDLLRGQLLLHELGRAAPRTGAEPLAAGIDQGILRTDDQGRMYVLLLERPGDAPLLALHLLSQPQAGAPFQLTWQSRNEALWSLQAVGSTVTFTEQEGQLLPSIAISAPLANQGALRDRVDVANLFVEQTPFARHWVETVWQPVQGNDTQEGATASIVGYRLEQVALPTTPLTTLGKLLAVLQTGEINDATAFAARVDLLQQMFELGLNQPAVWLVRYLKEDGEPASGNEVTTRLQLFDNADRNRTYELRFDQDEEGIYRAVAIEQTAPYGSDIITPAPTFVVDRSTNSSGNTVLIRPTQTVAATAADATLVTDIIAAATNAPQAPEAIFVPSSTPEDTPTSTATSTATSTLTPTPPPVIRQP
ncbi:MAG: hypothetical protein R2932_47125 [Caldilineaceae bacterium]